MQRFTNESVLEHIAAVQALCGGLLSNNLHDAEDVAQDTWVRHLTSAPDPSRPLMPWFRTVARNEVARRILRRRAPRADENVEEPTSSVSPEETLARQELLDSLRASLADLRPIHQEVIRMRYLEGLALKDIAAHLEIPIQTVKTRLRRGLEQLRESIDRRYGGRDKWYPAALLWVRLPEADASLRWGTKAKLFAGMGVLGSLVTWSLVGSADLDRGMEPPRPAREAWALEAEPLPERGRGLDLNQPLEIRTALGDDATSEEDPVHLADASAGFGVAGKVVSSNGLGLPGIEVVALEGAYPALYSGDESKIVGATRTDANGEFLVEGVQAHHALMARDPERGLFGLYPRPPSGLLRQVQWMDRHERPEGTLLDPNRSASLSLVPCDDLWVRVSGPRGRALAGATIRVVGQDVTRRVVEADQQGRAHLSWLPVGPVLMLEVSAPGMGTQLFGPSPFVGADEDLAVQLQDERVLSGQLVDEEGHPLSGVRLSLDLLESHASLLGERPGSFMERGTYGSPAPVRTDERGRFVFRQLADSEYLLCCTFKAVKVDRTYTLRPGEDLVLRPEGSDSLSVPGKVVRAEDGQHVPQATVRAIPPRKLGHQASELFAVDDRGRFQLRGKQAGRWRILADAEGYAPTEVWRDLRAGAQELELRLSPGYDCSLTVVDRDGGPIRDAWLRVMRNSVWHEDPFLEAGYVGTYGRTDEEGGVLLRDLPDQDLFLHVYLPYHTRPTQAVFRPEQGGDQVIVLDARQSNQRLPVQIRVEDAQGSRLRGLVYSIEARGEDGALLLDWTWDLATRRGSRWLRSQRVPVIARTRERRVQDPVSRYAWMGDHRPDFFGELFPTLPFPTEPCSVSVFVEGYEPKQFELNPMALPSRSAIFDLSLERAQ